MARDSLSIDRALSLSGVPETMLWTLHNRAHEAMRRDGFLIDPEAVRIYRAIPYDYARRFGPADPSHAMRSRLFDRRVRPWLLGHPGGTVVELACGLETAFQRCDDGDVRWLCVDVPEALDVRQRFLPPRPRCRFVAKSALDTSWMDDVDASNGVFVTAQGLLMYFDEADVRRLIAEICERFPGVELMFDTIPRWFSRKTLKGFAKTRHYTAPRMPWGIDCDEIEPTLRGFSSRIDEVTIVPYGAERGALGLLLKVLSRLPWLRNVLPSIVHLRTSPLQRSNW
jgi:O-methyltransferase involved in polyketide biosynthesis